MNRREVCELLDAYYDAFNGRDKARILDVFAEDATFLDLTMGRELTSREALSNFIDETWALSPFFRLEPEDTLIDGSSAAVRLFMSGAAKVGSNGVPNPKDVWRIHSTSFFKMGDKHICWKADCWNMLAIPDQIGWRRTLPTLLKTRMRRSDAV